MIDVNSIYIFPKNMQLDKKVAETTLREHKGDAIAAVRHLLRTETWTGAISSLSTDGEGPLCFSAYPRLCSLILCSFSQQ